MIDKGVCRTTPATPGLLNIMAMAMAMAMAMHRAVALCRHFSVDTSTAATATIASTATAAVDPLLGNLECLYCDSSRDIR